MLRQTAYTRTHARTHAHTHTHTHTPHLHGHVEAAVHVLLHGHASHGLHQRRYALHRQEAAHVGRWRWGARHEVRRTRRHRDKRRKETDRADEYKDDHAVRQARGAASHNAALMRRIERCLFDAQARDESYTRTCTTHRSRADPSASRTATPPAGTHTQAQAHTRDGHPRHAAGRLCFIRAKVVGDDAEG
jgi:hypothetical protein